MRRFTYALAVLALLASTGRIAAASPTDDVRTSMLAFAKATSYRITFPDRSSGETFYADYGGPEKMHIYGGNQELIVLGTNAYMKENGAWNKLPYNLATGFSSRFMADVVKTREAALHAQDYTATDLGMKSVDGEMLHAYSVQKKTSSGPPGTIYIGRDGYVHRIDTESGYIRFSNFNQPINISAPM